MTLCLCFVNFNCSRNCSVNDGDSIIIGISFLFLEDVLQSRVAHYWSPDGANICFAKFNVSEVPLIKFPYYGESTNVYNDIIEIAYPKVCTIVAVKESTTCEISIHLLILLILILFHIFFFFFSLFVFRRYLI